MCINLLLGDPTETSNSLRCRDLKKLKIFGVPYKIGNVGYYEREGDMEYHVYLGSIWRVHIPAAHASKTEAEREIIIAGAMKLLPATSLPYRGKEVGCVGVEKLPPGGTSKYLYTREISDGEVFFWPDGSLAGIKPVPERIFLGRKHSYYGGFPFSEVLHHNRNDSATRAFARRDFGGFFATFPYEEYGKKTIVKEKFPVENIKRFFDAGVPEEVLAEAEEACFYECYIEDVLSLLQWGASPEVVLRINAFGAFVLDDDNSDGVVIDGIRRFGYITMDLREFVRRVRENNGIEWLKQPATQAVE